MPRLQSVVSDETFEDTWRQLYQVATKLLAQHSVSLTAGLFEGLAKLIRGLQEQQNVDLQFAVPALQLCHEHHPADWLSAPRASDPNKADVAGDSNQDAFRHHADLFLRTLQFARRETICKPSDALIPKQIMLSLQKTVFNCTHGRYTSDVKKVSSEQEKVLEILPILANMADLPRREYIEFLLRFIQAALHRDDGVMLSAFADAKYAQAVHRPSFVAFSTSCINSFNAIIKEYPVENNASHDFVASQAVEVLSDLVKTKSSPLPQNPDLRIWRVASTTLASLVDLTMRHALLQSNNLARDDMSGIFLNLPTAAAAFLIVDNSEDHLSHLAAEQLDEDESFDIEQFQKLHKSVIPGLGMSFVSEEVRRQYVFTLFNASLVSKPFFVDVTKDTVNAPLEAFSKVRPGTVLRPQFFRRNKICYAALDAIFELVLFGPHHRQIHSVADDGLERREYYSRLARTAAPFVLLRVAHPLKTFLADQPLRGLTPLPSPAQRELCYILAKCIELRVDDDAFHRVINVGTDRGTRSTTAPASRATESPPSSQRQAPTQASSVLVGHDGKSHLRLLFPLILRTQDCWRRLPRLEGGGAWQDQDDEQEGDGCGRRIETLLMTHWAETLAEGWVV